MVFSTALTTQYLVLHDQTNLVSLQICFYLVQELFYLSSTRFSWPSNSFTCPILLWADQNNFFFFISRFSRQLITFYECLVVQENYCYYLYCLYLLWFLKLFKIICSQCLIKLFKYCFFSWLFLHVCTYSVIEKFIITKHATFKEKNHLNNGKV